MATKRSNRSSSRQAVAPSAQRRSSSSSFGFKEFAIVLLVVLFCVLAVMVY